MFNSKLFWSFSLVGLFVYSMNKAGYVFPDPIQFYLNDLLVIPIVATLGMWLMRAVLQQRDLILVRWQVIFTVAAFSIVFEMILPFLMKRYTADPIDVLIYLIGGLFYWKMMNK